MGTLENSEYDNMRIQRHISVVWKIKNFSSRLANTNSGFSSSRFCWYDSVWFMTIYPKGYIGYQGEQAVNVRIEKKSADRESAKSPPACIFYKIGLKDKSGFSRCTASCRALYTIYTRYFCASALIRTDELLGEKRSELLHDDTLTVFCEMKMGYESAEEQITNISVATSTSAKGIDSLANDLGSFFKQQRNCDVILQAETESFPAHKIILIARSEVFSAMFSLDMLENNSNVVNITDISAEVLKDMLHYIYTGDVQDFSVKKAFELYPAADKYALNELKTQCSEIMLGHLCVNSLCDLAMLADMHNDTRVMEKVKCFAGKNAPLLLSSDKWSDLLKKNPSVATEILQVLTSQCTKYYHVHNTTRKQLRG